MAMDLAQRITVRTLEPAEWETLAAVRLEALKDAPDAFAALLSEESCWREQQWREAFTNRIWYVAILDVEPQAVGLARMFRQPDEPHQRYIESMWVAPEYRQHGVARTLIEAIIDQARREPSVRVVSLWVLEGNDVAGTIYRRLGFRPTDEVKPLWYDPSRTETRFTRPL